MADVARPRDERETIKDDWFNVLCALRMIEDRALDGKPLHFTRPSWLSPQADYRETMKAGVISILDNIFRTAVIDDA